MTFYPVQLSKRVYYGIILKTHSSFGHDVDVRSILVQYKVTVNGWVGLDGCVRIYLHFAILVQIYLEKVHQKKSRHFKSCGSWDMIYDDYK